MYLFFVVSRISNSSVINVKDKITLKQLSSFLPESLSLKVLKSSELSNCDCDATPFLNPTQVKLVFKEYEQIPLLKLNTCGGFSNSLRKRIIFSRQSSAAVGSQVQDESVCSAFLKAVRIQGTHQFETFKYKEFMSHLEGCKINCVEDIGDAIFGDNNKIDVVCSPEVLPTLLSLKEIVQIPVLVQEIQLTDLFNKIVKVKDITSIENSLRIDAVASAGFGMSRSKMTNLIDSGVVTLNWKYISKTCNIQVIL